MTHIRALQRLLDQLAAVLIELSPDVYVARPASRPSGSIGQHVRHVLDHVTALNTADLDVGICYDRRERGTSVETDVAAALTQLWCARMGLARWTNTALDTPILVSSVLDGSRPTVGDWSTLGRELCFVISHTIHHQALISLLIAGDEAEMPARFGYAPSTPAA